VYSFCNAPKDQDCTLRSFAINVTVKSTVIVKVKPKPSQSSNLGGICAKRKLTSPCLLDIPAFDRIAGLCNRHLNSNRGICLR